MVRIPSIFTSQGEEVWKLPKERLNNGFLQSVGKSAQKKFWITAWSVVNILSPEKRLDCGIDTVGPDHPVNVALEVCNT